MNKYLAFMLTAIFASLLFFYLIFFGVYIGAPIAINIYDPNRPREVEQLFVMMVVFKFYITIPVCGIFGGGVWLLLRVKAYWSLLLYTIGWLVFLPIIFFGITISLYNA